jgi:hypothetical protein
MIPGLVSAQRCMRDPSESVHEHSIASAQCQCRRVHVGMAMERRALSHVLRLVHRKIAIEDAVAEHIPEAQNEFRVAHLQVNTWNTLGRCIRLKHPTQHWQLHQPIRECRFLQTANASHEASIIAGPLRSSCCRGRMGSVLANLGDDTVPIRKFILSHRMDTLLV